MGKSMRITRACDYAFRAMVFLAGHDGQPVETARVAQEVDVPPVYLRKILQSLSRAQLVRSTAGTGGGVVLALPPSQITLRGIVEAVEGPITLSDCIEHPDVCCRSSVCRIHEVLADIQQRLKDDFATRTLADLL